MISGSACWNRALQRGMSPRSFGGRAVITYDDLPASLYHMLLDTARRTPGATAIVDDWHRATSFSGLLARVDELAAYLASTAR